MSDTGQHKEKQQRRHGVVALSLVGLVAGMTGLAFASVPLYRLFCQTTGYGGVPQRAERALFFFKATNNSDAPVAGTAVFNVVPELAGRYFTKIECFCFKEQTLAAGASIEMPVTFFVDPQIVDDEDTKNISEITLSYTFYRTGE